MARVAAGETIWTVAGALRISPSCVSKWSGRLRATGSVLPGKVGGHKPRVLSGAPADWLRHRMSSEPFTPRGLARGLAAELTDRGVRVDYRAVWEFAHREGPSFKKTVVAAEQTRPDIARKRAPWKAYQRRFDRERLVFIDETWVILRQHSARSKGI